MKCSRVSGEKKRLPITCRVRETGPGEERFEAARASEEKERPDVEPWLLCRFCAFPITRRDSAVSINGRHAHVFANPSGYVFRIRCFRSAPGCRTLGRPSDEFTWFAGFRWQVAVCGGCGAHLGWRFASGANMFHGLIADHLLAP